MTFSSSPDERLHERLHVDLRRQASALCRRPSR
ncbi:putative leader peptide [Actinomadura fibrosa]|uniref:Leader peptide n=1 Tax=Actinomadura fibrosa TaxID=111802 RepID=A0ABW2XIP2_9ACTN|nr:putative leader peptide [Actinomadura fibrosa]